LEDVMRAWQMQEAKARLAEVIRRAEDEGPQAVSVRGREAVVVLSRRDYDRLTGGGESLAAFIRRSPLSGIELEVERDRSPGREVDL
jgi:antitoxin Phd